MNDALNVPAQIHRLDLVALRDLLLCAGWDAIASDLLGEMAARFDRPPGGGVWTLDIDRAGRFKFRSTRTSAGSTETQQLRSVSLVTLAVEDRRVLTITGQLNSFEDLELVLPELAQLVGDRVLLMDPDNPDNNPA